eukprot:1013558-Pyramimonas_sp.AAC.1
MAAYITLCATGKHSKDETNSLQSLRSYRILHDSHGEVVEAIALPLVIAVVVPRRYLEVAQ